MEIAHKHSLERWKAEEENARRLGAKATALQAMTSALLGAGLVTMGGLKDAWEKVNPGTMIAIQVFLVLALFLFGASLFQLLFRRGGNPTAPASRGLAWPTQIDPVGFDGVEAQRTSWMLVEASAGDLMRRNSQEETVLILSQVGICFASVFLTVAGILYAVADRVPL